MFPRLCCCRRVIVPFCWSCDNLLSWQNGSYLLPHRESRLKRHTPVSGGRVKGCVPCGVWGNAPRTVPHAPAGNSLFVKTTTSATASEALPLTCGGWGNAPRTALLVPAGYYWHGQCRLLQPDDLFFTVSRVSLQQYGGQSGEPLFRRG